MLRNEGGYVVDIGHRMKDLRIQYGLTQQELADEAHMTVSQLQRLEYGERKVENLSLKTALALARALGVEVSELE